MPKSFTHCVKNGGNVITKKIDEETYQHVCYDGHGKPHYGEIKKKKKPSKKTASESVMKW